MAAAADTIDKNKYSLFIETVQSSEIKCLVEALKDMLIHTNIEVTQQGLKIVQVGRERISMVNMILNASSFQNFYVESDMVLGLNLINLNSLLRSVGSHDTLTLFIHRNERNRLGIKLQDAGKNKVSRFMLDLIELDYVMHQIPNMTPQSVITMPSSDFQQTCRALGLITDEVDIRCAGNQIAFKGKGDYAEQITAFGETEDGIVFNEKANPQRPVQGVFNLKKLISFTKCTNLSNTIKIYMLNDSPLIVEYSITDMGWIKLCLSPKTT